ncbi:hypothetical protein [Achromobacter insolitus]|uniref:hypothetical protein n=1 Tax=Achromobacter insolitus TaxID=217204 RepID=UPI0020A53927|nr:hypothetical protein [Achromobacter insolitus]MCP1404465.1 hypothetical protein [Achromobacter insolitus]
MTTPLPAGWKLVAVNEAFDDLMFWLDRCHDKGHLDNCYDLVAPWEAFKYDDPPATTQDDTLARTGNTADHQEGWYAGIDHGRAEARASAQGDAKDGTDLNALFIAGAICSHLDMALDQSRVMAAARYISQRFAAPAAGDARDAERYRALHWMAADPDRFQEVVEACSSLDMAKYTPENLNALADAAIAAQQGKGGEA